MKTLFNTFVVDIRPGMRLKVIVEDNKQSFMLIDIATPKFEKNDDGTESETPSTLHWMMEIGIDFKSNIEKKYMENQL